MNGNGNGSIAILLGLGLLYILWTRTGTGEALPYWQAGVPSPLSQYSPINIQLYEEDIARTQEKLVTITGKTRQVQEQLSDIKTRRKDWPARLEIDVMKAKGLFPKSPTEKKLHREAYAIVNAKMGNGEPSETPTTKKDPLSELRGMGLIK
jgi:hypothetical protein